MLKKKQKIYRFSFWIDCWFLIANLRKHKIKCESVEMFVFICFWFFLCFVFYTFFLSKTLNKQKYRKICFRSWCWVTTDTKLWMQIMEFSEITFKYGTEMTHRISVSQIWNLFVGLLWLLKVLGLLHVQIYGVFARNRTVRQYRNTGIQKCV